jgi:hypothetical protein
MHACLSMLRLVRVPLIVCPSRQAFKAEVETLMAALK